MTPDGPHAMREDGWDRFRGDGDDVDAEEELTDDVETTTVRERLVEEIDAERIHGFHVTRRNGDTFYVVFSRSTTWDEVDEDVDMDIPVTDLRTAVVDLEDDKVRVHGNGIWFPREADVSQGLAGLLARTGAEQSDGWDAETDPLLGSSVDGVDADLLLDREIEVEDAVDGQDVEKMKRHTGIDPSRPWGYGGGPPPEVSKTVERLTEAGLDPSEHLSRLIYGKKEPLDRKPRPVEELVGNYGIELQPRDSGLIALDIDYPENFPTGWDLPETFEVSSPHGDDSRRHVVYRCDEKERLAREIGAWAVQSIEWGDLWIGDRYLVGPGSQLSEFGCDDGDHQRGEAGGCEACEDPESGYYRVVNDAPIATVSADAILSLLDVSDGYTLRNSPASPEPPESESDDDQEDDSDLQTCDSCGAAREPENLKELASVTVCRGGCDE